MRKTMNMDIDFQDRIDEYLLRGDRMSDGDKARLVQEMGEDPEKRRQYELTRSVLEAVTSREQKLKAMAGFESDCRRRHVGNAVTGWRRMMACAAAIAAAIVAAVVCVDINTGSGQPGDVVRGDDGVFGPAPADSVSRDSGQQMSESIRINYPKPLKR